MSEDFFFSDKRILWGRGEKKTGIVQRRALQRNVEKKIFGKSSATQELGRKEERRAAKVKLPEIECFLWGTCAGWGFGRKRKRSRPGRRQRVKKEGKKNERNPKSELTS